MINVIIAQCSFFLCEPWFVIHNIKPKNSLVGPDKKLDIVCALNSSKLKFLGLKNKEK